MSFLSPATPAAPCRPYGSTPSGLIKLIDYTVERWLPFHQETTEIRLRCIARIGHWSTDDVDGIVQWTRQLQEWVERIDGLLTPQHVKQVSAPCPACGATTAYRRDSAGDRVRVSALQIVTQIGCTCLVCRTTWAPDHYLFLCRLLGFELPRGRTGVGVVVRPCDLH